MLTATTTEARDLAIIHDANVCSSRVLLTCKGRVLTFNRSGAVRTAGRLVGGDVEPTSFIRGETLNMLKG